MQKSQRRVILERLMRDSIIINKSGIVEKMGIFQYIDIEQDNLDNENEEEIFEKEFDEKKFILYRFNL